MSFELKLCSFVSVPSLFKKQINAFDSFGQIYNMFREIFKFREDKSSNVFRKIPKCFRKTTKFEFFAKQIIYLESPDHPLQNDI